MEVSDSSVSLTSVPWKIMKQVLLEATSRHMKGKMIKNSQCDCTSKLITFGDEIMSVDPKLWMSSTLPLAGLLKKSPAASTSLGWDVTECKLLE